MWSPVLDDQPCLSEVEWVEKEVDAAGENEFLGARDLFKLFDVLRKGAFRPAVHVAV